MIHQPLLNETQMTGNLYSFSEYKKKKPFFKKPLKISVGSSFVETYYMVNNVVFNEKQILALRKERDSQIVFLVEAIIEDGQLTCISKLPEEELGELATIMKASIYTFS